MDFKTQISSKDEVSLQKPAKQSYKGKKTDDSKHKIKTESLKFSIPSIEDCPYNNSGQNESSSIHSTRRRLSIVNELPFYQEYYINNPIQFISNDTKKKLSQTSQQLSNISKLENPYKVALNTDEGCVQSYSSLSIPGESPFQGSKQNQDEYIELPNYYGIHGNFLFAVMDGHGYQGHYVSKMLKDRLPIIIKSECGEKIKISSLGTAFNQANLELTKSQIDCSLSGSTCIVILLLKNYLISANVGDSRAVLGSFINGKWKTTPLSYDHKPSDPNEIDRILEKGGRVEPYITENGVESGPPRVWLGTTLIPGLAMSRSLGDSIAASVGVISKPDIIEHKIEPEDKIIILASDGVWEFITNEESIKIVAPFYSSKDSKGACDALIKESVFRWLKSEGISDDITCIIIFLKS